MAPSVRRRAGNWPGCEAKYVTAFKPIQPGRDNNGQQATHKAHGSLLPFEEAARY